MQPPNAIDCQVADEDMEAGTYDQMIQDDSVPFCFESFQFLKGELHSKSLNGQPVGNQQSLGFNVEDEGVVAEIHDLMMQEDYVPFCFEAFQFIRQNLRNISQEKEEQPVGCHTVSRDTVQQSSQIFDDPIADVLDDVCSQSLSPLILCKVETCADIDLIRQPVSLSFLAGVSSQSSSQSSDQSLHSWYEEKRSNPLDELSPSVHFEILIQHEFQDPYAVFLEANRESIVFNGSVHKFSWELPFSSSLLLFINEHLQRIQTAAGILTWLHWLFHFI